MLLYTNQITPRLEHTAQWLGSHLFGQPLRIIHDVNAIAKEDVVINYSHQLLPISSFQIQPCSLLFESSIAVQQIDVKQHGETPFFFETGGDFHFDVLAASFYLLQRYEEYLPHTKDKYDRYAFTNSVAFQNNFLHLPVVDLWMLQLKAALQQKFPQLLFAERRFQYLPTYDVDIAYSYSGKGILRSLWGLYRSLATRQMQDLMQRVDFVFKGVKDPFDIFDELDELHQQYGLQPIYFLLLAQRQQGIDKNINPDKNVYRRLIQKLAAQYKTGIHFSGAAAVSFTKMKEERAVFQKLAGKLPMANRMHYLLAHLPETYQQLQQVQIQEDYTMGYGSINGFRAGTCTPYYWYDLSTETSTGLQIFPFCCMDAVFIFDEEATPAGALHQMKQLLQTVKQVHGCFISIFHNHLIGRSSEGQRWMQLYKQFLSEVHS